MTLLDAPIAAADIDLAGTWTLTGGGHALSIDFPGDVHSALLAAGMSTIPTGATARPPSTGSTRRNGPRRGRSNGTARAATP